MRGKRESRENEEKEMDGKRKRMKEQKVALPAVNSGFRKKRTVFFGFLLCKLSIHAMERRKRTLLGPTGANC